MHSEFGLHAFSELLREFSRRLKSTRGIEDALESGFGYLMSRFHMDSVALFWWTNETRCLRMQYVFHQGTLMEGEEEILIESHGNLSPLVDQHVPIVVSEKSPWVAYIPLMQNNELIGAIRIQRERPLPRGLALENLPSIDPHKLTRSKEFAFLEDIADILSYKIQDLFQDQGHRKKEMYFLAGSEIATAVVEMPRLVEMLESVSQSIVRNLGLDRIRFYLVEPGKFELCGAVGLQLPARKLNLENEKYSLRESENPMVDVVLTGSNEVKRTSGNHVAYVPLMVGRQVVGLMVVDNLLSQQEIDGEQMGALKTLAGQIGMAVVNARLFEDIEQQAITDGLTKLYVYRYFQQRLKEEIDRADRYSYSVALVMMDVDHFKGFNDSYGHQLGDKVLEFLSQAIRSNIRRIDLAARYGGDEFVLLLPEITEQEAWLMGTRLLNALKECTLRTPEGELIPVRVTMGVALYPIDAQNGRDLIEAADRALYWAKKNSRGEICFYRSLREGKGPSKNIEKMA